MPVQITSTTDSTETVTAALGEKSGGEVEKTSASASADEISEDSETSDHEENSLSSDDEGSEDETKSDDKPKKKNGFKKRIDKLNSKLSAKEQEVDYWRQQALKGQAPKEAESKSANKEAAQEGKPKPDDFESHNAYVEALTDWKVDQKAKEFELKQREAQTRSEFQKRVSSHTQRVEKFAAVHDDFDELVHDLDEIPMSIGVQETILSSDHGPELMYELAKNPKEYARICELPPLAAARELGKIEARVQRTSSETKEEKRTKPAPLKPVGSNQTGSGKKSIYDPSLSQREYEQLRADQQRRRV